MDLQEAFESGFEAVKKYVDHALGNFEKRIARIEKKPALRYVGVFVEGDPYEPGEFVTHDGSLWHCMAATTKRPGTSSDWTLAVKRGKDGRDGR